MEGPRGRTIRFPGGIGSFMKKNHPRHEDEKKNLPHQGAKKKNHPCCNFFEIFRKKNHPCEGDEKKNPPWLSEEKNPLTKLPTPWKCNGASQSECSNKKDDNFA